MKIISNMEKLKVLTESLIDRDFIRARVLNLFDMFCNDFPIPTNAWIVNKDLEIVTKKGGIVSKCKENASLETVFSGDAKKKNIDMHIKALEGEIVTYIIKHDDQILLTKLIPSKGDINLVFGISMDVTMFVNAIQALEITCGEDLEVDCEKVEKIKNSDLYKIVKQEV